MSTLYLLPTPLGDDEKVWLLPHDLEKIRHIQYFVVEAEKTARRHLKLLNLDTPLQQLHLSRLDEHSKLDSLPEILSPLLQGHDMALMSEAGCPAVADPGATLVALAHRHNIDIVPLVGASSLLLALMASGANGQRFAFQGYLPADSDGRKTSLRQLEKKALAGESQIFIETPYRNDVMLADILSTLHRETHLCVASDLLQQTQSIISATIGDWHAKPLPNLKKRPTVFIIY
ncbi:MAG: SAM-dependent methyltransferase [Neisseriaceae bacterium]|nr:SAM-dependent methyltransferase [Neisseriaceae bacterium]